VNEERLYLGAGIRAECRQHCRAIDRAKRTNHIGGLVWLHGLEHGGGLHGFKFFEEVGCGFRVHFIENLAGVVWGQVLEEVHGPLLIERLKDVSSVMGIVFGQFFPCVVVGIEILLGLFWPLASEIPEGRAELARARDAYLHGSASLSLGEPVIDCWSPKRQQAPGGRGLAA
jgi:hypothetical protein